MNILVVDDEKLIVWSIRRMLEKAGFCVTAAFSAEEARTHFESKVFDLIITDDRMPGVCGQELIREIRQRSSGKTKCLLMSGANSPGRERKAEADGFIEKPFLLAELRSKIAAMVP